MSKQFNLIFLGGVHGVGKSTFAEKLSEVMGIETVSASALIKKARKGKVTWSIDKQTGEIDENQRLLLMEVNHKRLSGGSLILDGHYVLRNSTGTIEKIPVELFKQLQPSILLVLAENPSIILDRLNSRSDTSQSLKDIIEIQKNEIEHAKNVSEALNIKLIEIKVPDEDVVSKKIQAGLNNSIKGALEKKL